MNTLGERIAARRKELGLTQGDLARAVGISQAAVSQWENGETKNLRVDHLFAIADVLQVHPRWLGVGYGPKIHKVAVHLLWAIPPLLAAWESANCVLCKITSRSKFFNTGHLLTAAN